MDLDARIDPDKDLRGLTELCGDFCREVDVIEAVQHYPLNPLGHGALEFLPGLVVAMQHELSGWHACGPGHVVLARGRDVQ